MKMVPGAYSPVKLTVVRGIGLDPPPPLRKKLGPPPMMSRKSVSWACAWPATARTVTAANSKARTRVIFFLAK